MIDDDTLITKFTPAEEHWDALARHMYRYLEIVGKAEGVYRDSAGSGVVYSTLKIEPATFWRAANYARGAVGLPKFPTLADWERYNELRRMAEGR